MNTKKGLAIAAVVVLGLVIAGCMSAHQRSAEHVLDDATITATVKTKLLAANTRVRAFDIDVDTQSGAVTLSGGVRDSKARDAALDIARTVSGVSSVRDLLTIKTRLDPAGRVPAGAEGRPAVL